MEPLLPQDAELKSGAKEREESGKIKWYFDIRCSELYHKIPDPPVEVIG